MTDVDRPLLGEDFPSLTVDVSLGDWWRIHSDAYGPWWFSSRDLPIREEVDIGRFDLPHPHGTCYLGAYPVGAAAEVFREAGVEAPAAQRAADERRLSQMSLKRWSDECLADFTSPQAALHGVPEDIAGLTRAEARPWAEAAHEAGFKGIIYRLREDPLRRRGMALFHTAGEYPPDDQPFPIPLPVGLRRELSDLFEGEYRGAPLPK
jgi:hypothetical protein